MSYDTILTSVEDRIGIIQPYNRVKSEKLNVFFYGYRVHRYIAMKGRRK